MVPSEISTPGSGPLTKKANAFFKASATIDQCCRGQSRPAPLTHCWLMHSRSWYSAEHLVEKMENTFSNPRRRKPSSCHWNSKIRAAWMGKK